MSARETFHLNAVINNGSLGTVAITYEVPDSKCFPWNLDFFCKQISELLHTSFFASVETCVLKYLRLPVHQM